MDIYRELFQISRLLLAEADYQSTVEAILERLLESTGAERGFIVVREGNSFSEAFNVRYASEELSQEERRFSRSLVREAIKNRCLMHSAELVDDSRFAAAESVQQLNHRAALVAPLLHDEEVHGCIYLEREGPVGFSAELCELVEQLGQIAGLVTLRALELERLKKRNRSLERDLFARYDFSGILTRDPAMLRLLEMVGQVADSEASILILGETGTGKELIARALHLNSPRRSRPFVTLHCAALPGELLEAELFGHVAGAYTGASKGRAGRIAAAHGGTLFLDEVGEIPLETQAKLLRFLQFGELQRLGADRVEKVDVRVVSATHRELPKAIQEGSFREDLYYRLRVLDLELPPLRARQGDISLLLDHLMERHWRRGESPRWTPRARAAVLHHPFPGNVRELEHLVQRVCLLARGESLDVDLLPEEFDVPRGDPSPVFAELSNEGLKEAKARAQAQIERLFLEQLLSEYGGNISQAARAAGFHRTFLQKMLARHDLNRKFSGTP